MSTSNIAARAGQAGRRQQPGRDLAPTEQRPLSARERHQQEQAAKARQMGGFVEQLLSSGALSQALPKHVNPERITRIALTALRTTPKLADCTRESFLGALMTAAQLGLEVNTPNGEAYLIPYGNECTFVLGYQGLAKLFWQHPDADVLQAHTVHERDEFRYSYGLNPDLHHVPATGDRGDVTHFYAVAKLRGRSSAFVVLTPEDVRALRGKLGSKDVTDPQRWMDKKSAIKQVLKLMPKTVELAAAVQADEKVRSDYASTLEAMSVSAPAEVEGDVVDAPPLPADPSTGEMPQSDDVSWPEPAPIPADAPADRGEGQP